MPNEFQKKVLNAEEQINKVRRTLDTLQESLKADYKRGEPFRKSFLNDEFGNDVNAQVIIETIKQVREIADILGMRLNPKATLKAVE